MGVVKEGSRFRAKQRLAPAAASDSMARVDATRARFGGSGGASAAGAATGADIAADAARAYAAAAPAAVAKEPRETFCPATLCFAWKRPERLDTPLYPVTLLLERCRCKPSASVATVGGGGGWYSPTARAYATAASTAVPNLPRDMYRPPVHCSALKRPLQLSLRTPL